MESGFYGVPTAALTRLTRAVDAFERTAIVPTIFDPTAYGTTTFWGRADTVSGAGVDVTKPAAQQCLQWDNKAGGSAVTTTASSTISPFWIPSAWQGLPGIVFNGRGMTAGISTATGAAARSIVAVGLFPQTPNTSTSVLSRIIAIGDTTTTADTGFSLVIAGSAYRLAYITGASNNSGGGTTATAATASQTVPDVLIGTYDGTTAKLFVNGSQVVSEAKTLATTADNLSIGTTVSGGLGNLVGILLECAALSVNLTASVGQITADLQSQWRIG